MTELRYGCWPSPISAADVAKAAFELESPLFVDGPDGPQLWWVEGRPAAGGRHALVRAASDGTRHDVLGPEWSPRSRIIEYGARPWARVPGGTVFAFWDDQRLYLAPDGGTPVPLTVAPTGTVEHRYGEPVLSPDGDAVWVVRETHREGVVSRTVVGVPLDGSAADDDDAVRVLADGHQFFAAPRPSPDGRRLAYIAWDHPDMPWDATVLGVRDVDAHASGPERRLLGGPGESVLQPEWADADHVYCVSDRSGWWNLYRVGLDGDVDPLAPAEQEFGGPLWVLGEGWYTVLDDGRLVAAHGVGRSQLSVIDPTTGRMHPLAAGLDFPYGLASRAGRVAGVAVSATLPSSIVTVDVATGSFDVVRSSLEELPDERYLPQPRSVTFAGAHGRQVHAVVYPPRHPEAEAPAGERPPYLAFVHGGPTAHVYPSFSITKAFFTSRGIGVVDVNYGGSTGYGRAYRELLRGQWGVVDVEDTVAAVEVLAASGEADGARLGIRGGSAGGWTTLAALVQSDTFAAGAAYFPVTDLLPFAKDTHDFESRYLDGLVGPLPEAHDVYVERSPMSHLDRLRSAVLLLQGDDDRIVPPSQPQAVNDALDGTGIPHAYLLFAGEQHGFRRAESQIAALEAELSFFGQVFGFEPPGVPRLQLSH